uniref:Uncharacterized protein n=1 Tax=Sphaerodactylus townsendi TaxID=933632 RepID=A0ACB8EUK9_9SAUR
MRAKQVGELTVCAWQLRPFPLPSVPRGGHVPSKGKAGSLLNVRCSGRGQVRLRSALWKCYMGLDLPEEGMEAVHSPSVTTALVDPKEALLSKSLAHASSEPPATKSKKKGEKKAVKAPVGLPMNQPSSSKSLWHRLETFQIAISKVGFSLLNHQQRLQSPVRPTWGATCYDVDSVTTDLHLGVAME